MEVLGGPASVLHSRGALGGAINILTKQPTERTAVDAGASYGSQDTKHLTAGARGPIEGGFSYRVDGSWREPDG